MLYVLDSESRTEMGNEGGMFFVPVGDPCDAVKAPWSKDDGRCDGW